VNPAAFSELRSRLVAELRARGALHDARVAEAFARVPRHLFVPDVSPEDVYADRSIAIKLEDGVPISSSSQPAIMAEMIEMLALHDGDNVLEIGAGSGYNAALLAEMVGPSGSVTTIDIDDDLVAAARRHLDEAGYPHVRTLHGDGARGDAAHAPFDAVIASVGVEQIPPEWIAQLRLGGRLVAPLTIRSQQKVIAFERNARGLESRAVVDAAFMMLRGPSAGNGTRVIPLGDPTTTLRVNDERAAAIDTNALARALREHADDATPVRRVTLDELWNGFAFWLAQHDETFCRLTVQGPAAANKRVPNLMPGGYSVYGFASTLGVCDAGELVVFTLAGNAVVLRRYGEDRGGVDRVQRALTAWDAARRPGNAALHVTVDAGGNTHVTT
jgi:protein-L-isoaspartate(D-aspartate) O-methyltransferase